MAKEKQREKTDKNPKRNIAWKGWHILIPSISAILGILLGLVGRPWVDQNILEPNAIVAKVNGQSIMLKDFVSYAKLSRVEEVNYYQKLSQYVSLYSQYGMTVSAAYTQQLTQIQTELTDAKTFGQSVLTKMIDNVLLEAEAKKLGISVTDDDVTNLLYNSFGYFPAGTPTPQSTPTSFLEPTLSGTQKALLATPTSIPEPTLVPSLNPSGNETITLEVTPTISEPTPTIQIVPTTGAAPTSATTATPVTLQAYQTGLSTYMATLTPYGLTENDLRKYIYYQLLYTKVSEEITKSVVTHDPQVWIRHIQVASQTDAEKTLGRLQAGETWVKVASDSSTDSYSASYGGDLGWVPKGILTTELENAAFSMKVGDIQIVQDANGWHILQLLGNQTDRPIDSNYLSRLQSNAYSAWYTPILNAAKTQTYESVWLSHVPTEPALPAKTQ